MGRPEVSVPCCGARRVQPPRPARGGAANLPSACPGWPAEALRGTRAGRPRDSRGAPWRSRQNPKEPGPDEAAEAIARRPDLKISLMPHTSLRVARSAGRPHAASLACKRGDGGTLPRAIPPTPRTLLEQLAVSPLLEDYLFSGEVEPDLRRRQAHRWRPHRRPPWRLRRTPRAPSASRHSRLQKHGQATVEQAPLRKQRGLGHPARPFSDKKF